MAELITGYLMVGLVVVCCIVYGLTGWPWRFPYPDADRAARVSMAVVGLLIALAVVLAIR